MEWTFAVKSNKIFKQIALIIAAVVGLSFFIFFQIFQRVYLYAGVLIHKYKTDCGCTQMTQLLAMHPFIFGALLALSLVIIVFMGWAVYKFIRLSVQTRKFSNQYLTKARTKHSTKLEQIVNVLQLDKKRIIEIREAKPVVFCYGLSRPKVCISSGLIKILKQEELEAVLLHEHSHMVANEPIKLFIIKFFYSIFFFLPGIKTYLNKYVTFSELAADERATNNFTDRSKLARAILKISQAEDQHLLRTGLALSFFTSTIDERVNKLTDNAYIPKFSFFGKGFLFSLGAVIMATLLMIVLLSDSTQAFNMHDNGSCVATTLKANQSISQACELNSNQAICDQNGNFHKQIKRCNMR